MVRLNKCDLLLKDGNLKEPDEIWNQEICEFTFLEFDLHLREIYNELKNQL